MPDRSRRLTIKRVYDAPSEGDGKRVLVDRLWPRGLTKSRAAVELWLKDVAPSNALRQWFGHDLERWGVFQTRYRAELTANGDALARLRKAIHEGPVTLLYGAKDEAHNNAAALLEYLQANDGA